MTESAAKYDFMLKLSGDDFNAAIETIALAKKPELPAHMQHLSQDFETQNGKSALVADAEQRAGVK